MGLPVSVYRHGDQDSTNGGISSRSRDGKLTVVNVPGPYVPTVDAPAVLLVEGPVKFTAILVPAVNVAAKGDPPQWQRAAPDGHVGPLFGGNFADTSDSRFGKAVGEIVRATFYGAIPIHDRFETSAEYEALSR